MTRIIRLVVQCAPVLLLSTLWAVAQQPALVVQTNHSAWIHSVAFSPDGKILATGGSGDIKLWEIATRRQIRTMYPGGVRFDMLGEKPLWTRSKAMSVNLFERFDGNGWADTISSLSFSPDGNTLASGGTDKTLKLWKLRSKDHADNTTPDKATTTPVRVWFVTFDEKGETLLSIGEDNSYRFWDATTLVEITANAPSLRSFHLPWQSRNGRFKAEYAENRNTLAILDSTTNERRIIGKHAAGITSAVISPDGETVASCGWDRTVRIWDVTGKKKPRLLGGHDSFIASVAFSKDGKTLASVGGDLKVKLWDVGSGKERTLYGYGSRVEPVLIAEADQLLITKSENIVHVWNMKNGQKLRDLTLHKGHVNLVAFDPTKRMLATSDQTVNNLAQMTVCVALIFNQYQSSNEIKRTPETENCVVMEPLEKARTAPLILESFANFVTPKSPDPLGRYDELLISDNVISLWDPATDIVKTLRGHVGQISSLAISRDGDLLASGDSKGVLRLWRIHDNVTTSILAHDKHIEAIAFSPNGRKVASVDDNGILRLWNVKVNDYDLDLEPQRDGIKLNLKSVLAVEGFSEGVFSVFGRDAKNEFTSTSYDFATGQITTTPEMDLENKYELNRLQQIISNRFGRAITSDGKFVFEFDESGKLGLFAKEGFESTSSQLLGWLIDFDKNSWAVVTPDGHFDTNRLEKPDGLNWVFPDAPLTPLSFEIFMRDYYEPRLLPRLLKGEKLSEVPSLAELNRTQPKVEKITVLSRPGNPESVDVKVAVTSVAGQCHRSNKLMPCESGVYDLRLYRDGQLVGQAPNFESTSSGTNSSGQNRQTRLEQWRKNSLVKTAAGAPVNVAAGTREITFTDIQLPRRAGVSQVSFSAYAFNEDRVKSETSAGAVYVLSQSRPSARQRAYIIAMGVDATSDPSLRLGFAPHGARDVEQLLNEKLKSQYDVINVPLVSEYKEDISDLAQDLATKINLQTVLTILSGRDVTPAVRRSLPNLEQLRAATPDDLVVLYIASHGYADPNGKFYVIPSDIGDPAGLSEELLNRCLTSSEQSASCQAAQEFLRHSVSSDELAKWLQPIDAGQMVLVLDSCHSAAVSGPDFKPGPMGDRGFGQLSYDKGMLVLVATQAENLNWATLELGDRSLLTYALTQQQAAGQSFDLREWLSQAEQQVPELYRRFVKEKQQPTEEAQEPALFDFSRKQL